MDLKYFKDEDFECRCGCGMTVEERFAYKTDLARELAGVPFRPTSFARCKEHNKRVGGSETSSHLKGIAGDVLYRNSHEKFRIIFGLMRAGFTRIGINEAKSFIHFDDDDSKPQQVLFKY